MDTPVYEPAPEPDRTPRYRPATEPPTTAADCLADYATPKAERIRDTIDKQDAR
ncbi:hypothetical protein [Streptomyces sp. adm13(2018)]|uniref:hypothetical protein n=1 Tax=Streptomyces sp. adm13(2018) TaxID=2479007 RepID=UPI001650CAEA|nr:hypothetical protein [Streptomyces sp. adm13(2018)]